MQTTGLSSIMFFLHGCLKIFPHGFRAFSSHTNIMLSAALTAVRQYFYPRLQAGHPGSFAHCLLITCFIKTTDCLAQRFGPILIHAKSLRCIWQTAFWFCQMSVAPKIWRYDNIHQYSVIAVVVFFYLVVLFALLMYFTTKVFKPFHSNIL